MVRTWTAVTALVVVLAGCGDDEPTVESPDAPGEAVPFVASDLEFTEAPDELPSGEATIELINEADVLHNVTIEELDDLVVAETGPGESETGTVTLEPGTYTYYCSIPGHREAGMEGTLTVE